MNFNLPGLKQIPLNRNRAFVIALAIFSLLAGYLLAGISFVGKAGISMMYTEYQFLKTWWKGGLLVFIVWLILFVFQSVVRKRVGQSPSNVVGGVMAIIAIAGLLLSYSDFTNTLSHRWLGTRFHLGVYLFWLGWIGIPVFLFFNKTPVAAGIRENDNETKSIL
jgi:hypothetical protein